MTSRYAVIYEPDSEPGPAIPGIVAVMREFSEPVKGRVYLMRSLRSKEEMIKLLKTELEPGASVMVVRADEVAYFGGGNFAGAVRSTEAI